MSTDRLLAARKILGYLKQGADPGPLAHAARRLIFLKGRDAHDYKFSAAVLEDYSAEGRDAAGEAWLAGSGWSIDTAGVSSPNRAALETRVLAADGFAEPREAGAALGVFVCHRDAGDE